MAGLACHTKILFHCHYCVECCKALPVIKLLAFSLFADIQTISFDLNNKFGFEVGIDTLTCLNWNECCVCELAAKQFWPRGGHSTILVYTCASKKTGKRGSFFAVGPVTRVTR